MPAMFLLPAHQGRREFAQRGRIGGDRIKIGLNRRSLGHMGFSR